MNYFYDAQLRRYIAQFIRIFSDIKFKVGPDENGVIEFRRIPVVYGDPQRQAAAVAKGATQNGLNPVPMMAAWVSGIEMASDRRQEPYYESKIHGSERELKDGIYTENRGNNFTVERHMPVPYKLNMQLDIWTSNTESKLQILEQLLVIFNPMIQLQQTSNVLDWTSIFEVELTDIVWTSRSIPTGTDDERDVATLNFSLGIWINPPAKLKRQRLINSIVTNVTTIPSNILPDYDTIHPDEAQVITTPGDISLTLSYLDGKFVSTFHTNSVADIHYSEVERIYRNSIIGKKILFNFSNDLDDENSIIVGVVDEYLHDGTVSVNLDVDTFPSSSKGSIISVIFGDEQAPGYNLPLAEAGQSYIVLSDVSSGEETAVPDALRPKWGIDIYPNSIVTFNGSAWESSMPEENDSVFSQEEQTLLQFKNGSWEFYFLGKYPPGFWRILGSAKTVNPGDFDEC